MSRRYTRVDDERVEQLTLRGLSLTRIAEIMGCSERAVSRARKRIGVAQPIPRWMTAEEIALAERMLDDGASLTEVARTLDRHPTALWKRFPGRGWTSEQTGQYNALRNLEARLEL